MSSRSETLGKISLALSKAQAEMGGAARNSKNPFFKSNYADLESVWAACREPLSKNELAVVQTTESAERGLNIITMLLHSSGEWLSSTLNVKPQKDDPQALGSAISYGRRYALAAMVGIYQTDDDAESAMNRSGQTKSAPKQASKISQTQAKRLAKLLADSGRSTDKFLDWLNIEELEDLPSDEFARVEKALLTAIKNKSAPPAPPASTPAAPADTLNGNSTNGGPHAGTETNPGQ